MSESRTTLFLVPTRDEDCHRLIDGEDPDDPLRRGADAWLVFESLVDMDSAKAARDAIALADDVTVRRALMAAVVSRKGVPMTSDQRKGWLRKDATVAEIVTMFEFEKPDE